MGLDKFKEKYRSFKISQEKKKARKLNAMALETKKLKLKAKERAAEKKILSENKKAKQEAFNNTFAGGLWNGFKKEVKTRRAKSQGLFAEEARSTNRKNKKDSGLFSDDYDWSKWQ